MVPRVRRNGMRKGMGIVSTMAVVLVALCGLARAEDRPAPDFTLRDLEGNKVTLSETWGKGPVLISLWALWCRPCQEEMPHISDLQQEFRERGLQVLAVSQDEPRSLNKVKTFIQGKEYKFRVLLDPNKDLTRAFKTKLIPYTVVVDTAGRIVYERVGYRKGQEKELRDVVEGLFPPEPPEGTKE
jgi:cytochrome c biogenesis protein CcmG/thiol:disulfide interchange protein DsbE